MSEPTYRIELTHDPASGEGVCWRAAVYPAGEDGDYVIHNTYASTREFAFDSAQAWCRAKSLPPDAPSTVFLTEDGELLDPHEAHS